MTLPSELFRSVLDAGQLDIQAGDTPEIIQCRAAANINANFASFFARDEIRQFATNIAPSAQSLAVAEEIMTSVHDQYMTSLEQGNCFSFYIEEEDDAIVQKFQSGEAVVFFSEALKPYIADLLERGDLTGDEIKTGYSLFLSTSETGQCQSPEDFWDSSALQFYGNHLLYQAELEKLQQTSHHQENVAVTPEPAASYSPGC